MNEAYLQAVDFYFPERCLTNDDLSQDHPEWSAEKIAKKTGIQRRYLSADGETAADLAVKAAERLFAQGIDRKSVDYLILCTQSPDYFLPTTACILQERLGLSENCGAFDFNLGCSGYVYGLGIAKGLIVSGQAKRVLLLTAETYSKYLHLEDKSCRTIFGDGASASLLTADRMEDGLNARILQSSFRTFGNGFENLIVRNRASRNPVSDVDSMDNYLFMDGKAIFDFSAESVPVVIEENVSINGYQMTDVDYFILHQANLYMMNIVRLRSGIPADKFIVDLEDGGNTVSSTIPVALSRWTRRHECQEGEKICLCGFGVGLSIASIMLMIDGKS